jgi:hypothetical protein
LFDCVCWVLILTSLKLHGLVFADKELQILHLKASIRDATGRQCSDPAAASDFSLVSGLYEEKIRQLLDQLARQRNALLEVQIKLAQSTAQVIAERLKLSRYASSSFSHTLASPKSSGDEKHTAAAERAGMRVLMKCVKVYEQKYAKLEVCHLCGL